MASDWALARAADHLFGDNLPSGAEKHIRALAPLLDDVREEALVWDEAAKKDEWTQPIHDAFPTRSGSHDEYAVAMQMIGSRRSKGALVALVNWLLVERRQRVGMENVLAGAALVKAERERVFLAAFEAWWRAAEGSSFPPASVTNAAQALWGKAGEP